MDANTFTLHSSITEFMTILNNSVFFVICPIYKPVGSIRFLLHYSFTLRNLKCKVVTVFLHKKCRMKCLGRHAVRTRQSVNEELSNIMSHTIYNVNFPV